MLQVFAAVWVINDVIFTHIIAVELFYINCFTVTSTSSKQVDLYDETFRSTVDAVLEGYNGGCGTEGGGSQAHCSLSLLCGAWVWGEPGSLLPLSSAAGTVFAYGQTGTGKTYTMEGKIKLIRTYIYMYGTALLM